MAVSGDDVKTRGQKEKLEEIENENTPKITRSGTMAVTAEVREVCVCVLKVTVGVVSISLSLSLSLSLCP